MKKILLFILLIISTSTFSQNQKAILYNNFTLGIDKYEDIQNKVGFSDFDSYFEYDGKAEVAVITCVDYFYRLRDAKLTFKFVDDVLYSVSYFPEGKNQTKQKNLDRYFLELNQKYKIRYTKQEWYNDFITIKYIVDKNNIEYFIHYDNNLLKKYPDYQ